MCPRSNPLFDPFRGGADIWDKQEQLVKKR